MHIYFVLPFFAIIWHVHVFFAILLSCTQKYSQPLVDLKARSIYIQQIKVARTLQEKASLTFCEITSLNCIFQVSTCLMIILITILNYKTSMKQKSLTKHKRQVLKKSKRRRYRGLNPPAWQSKYIPLRYRGQIQLPVKK